MSKDKGEVPDPKSGRDSDTQNPDVVQQYADYIRTLGGVERMNEEKALRQEIQRVRTTMGLLQQQASHERRLYGVVTALLREALVSSRNAYRMLQRQVYAFNEVVRELEALESEEE